MEELLPKGALGHWTLDRSRIWQMRLLNQTEFADYVARRGLGYSSGLDIERLWQIGLLRADLVRSSQELDTPGLELMEGVDKDTFEYIDKREVSYPNGLSSIVDQLPELSSGITLFFHPFRYFVLYLVDRNLHPSIHPMQQLLWANGLMEVVQGWQEFFDRRTREPDLPKAVRYWESIAEMAIVAEPHLYERLFSVLLGQLGMSYEEQLKVIEKYWQDVRKYYEAVGVERLEKARQHLCIEAERLDPNKTVHTILRLTSGEQRINKIEGWLGGSMLLLTMAEMLRRATEDVFGVQLPEEDEKGFGITFSNAKKKLYGSKRILDGDQNAANAFLRLQGLDYGVRVRWYVEGDTEYYALQAILTNFPAIELVNLKGRVAERGDRGVSFRDSLRSDLRAERFSYVLLDADNGDYIRAVRKAAEDDDICGAFYISAPDFEFANFTLAELASILWQIAQENGVMTDVQPELKKAAQSCATGKDLLQVARRTVPELAQVGKGEDWGRKMMQYAVEHPKWTKADLSEPQLRPIVEALQQIIDAAAWDYKPIRQDLRVDPETGQLVERDKINPE